MSGHSYPGENDWRRFLPVECVEAYSHLDEAQRQRLQALLTTEPHQNVRPFVITTYERGKIEGRNEERREMALLLLETKFGPLSAEVKQRVETLSLDQLRQILLDFVTSPSLNDLRLQD